MSCYQHIQEKKAQHPIHFLCKVLKVSRSGFYDWQKKGSPAPRAQEEALRLRIKAIHTQSKQTYGAPRITIALRDQGIRVGHNRVARIMREEGINGLPKKKYRKRSKPSQTPIDAPNLLQRNFKTTAPNKAWVGDITYIWTAQGWLYLAVLIDLYSRRVVGWEARDNMETELCQEALRKAVILRFPSSGLIHHTDRGSQYTSTAYLAQLSQAGLHKSLSRAGDCWDNAVAESFFGTLKTELIYRHVWKSRELALAAIQDYIHNFYNPVRIHSTNNGLSPIKAEWLYDKNKQVIAA